ncbi:MarR family transcriptional regulator [Rhodobacteraceae bacterium D3-12]|nr:MarR family transcriptional regulator [Rhodobacteraceae bacterium D3-12]
MGSDVEQKSGADAPYRLDEQVGYLLRLAVQKHAIIFQKHAPFELTPTQFAALVRLAHLGECSQNELGRRTAMDVATIKGVVDRLNKKGFVQVKADPNDKRRSLLSVSDKGKGLMTTLGAAGHEISRETLKPLTAREQEVFLRLLKKLG